MIKIKCSKDDEESLRKAIEVLIRDFGFNAKIMKKCNECKKEGVLLKRNPVDNKWYCFSCYPEIRFKGKSMGNQE